VIDEGLTGSFGYTAGSGAPGFNPVNNNTYRLPG